jgi:hypothetical protein
MKDKRTAEGGDILNFENFVTRPMQEQGTVVCHEAALVGCLGGVAHLALKVTSGTGKQVKNEAPEQTSWGTARNAVMQVDHVRMCFQKDVSSVCAKNKEA